MFRDRVFQISILLSIITHLLILTLGRPIGIFTLSKKTERTEVSYAKHAQKQADTTTAREMAKKEPFLKIPSKITVDKRNPPPFIDKEALFSKTVNKIMKPADFPKPEILKPDLIGTAAKRKITLPPVDLEKINNPSYISYYQIVREKIKRAAYHNYTRTETGEVYVSFVIESNGSVRDTRIVDEKSSPSTYLRQTALGSVKGAAPFPNFPKELDYPQLSFNVVISFEIE